MSSSEPPTEQTALSIDETDTIPSGYSHWFNSLCPDLV